MVTKATADMVGRAIRRADRAVKSAVSALGLKSPGDLFALFEDFGHRLQSEVALTDFQISHLNALKQSIADQVSRLNAALQGDLAGRLGKAAALGRRATLDAVKGEVSREFGLEQIAGLSPSVLSTAAEFSADLVQDVSQKLRSDISKLIVRGVTTGKSGSEIQAELRKLLGRNGANTYSNRDAAIFQTETMRVYSMAEQASAEQLVEDGEDVVKMWHWSGKSRENHAAIDGQLREVKEFFTVPDPGDFKLGTNPTDSWRGEQALYPRDPRLTAANSVYCGCSSYTISREVAEGIAAKQGSKTFEYRTKGRGPLETKPEKVKLPEEEKKVEEKKVEPAKVAEKKLKEIEGAGREHWLTHKRREMQGARNKLYDAKKAAKDAPYGAQKQAAEESVRAAEKVIKRLEQTLDLHEAHARSLGYGKMSADPKKALAALSNEDLAKIFQGRASGLMISPKGRYPKRAYGKRTVIGDDGKPRHTWGSRSLKNAKEVAEFNLETARELWIELLRLNPDARLVGRGLKMPPLRMTEKGVPTLEANFKGAKFKFNIRKGSSGGWYEHDGTIVVHGTPRTRGLRHSGGWTFEHELGHGWHNSALEGEIGYHSSRGIPFAFQKEWERIVEKGVAFGKKHSKLLQYGDEFAKIVDDEVVKELVEGYYKFGADRAAAKWGRRRARLARKLGVRPDTLAPLGKKYMHHNAYNAPHARAIQAMVDVRLTDEMGKLQQAFVRNEITRAQRDRAMAVLERAKTYAKSESFHYRLTDRKEFFADGFAHYMNDGPCMKKLFPDFYEWLKVNVFGGREFESFYDQIAKGLWAEGTPLWKRADEIARLMLPPSQRAML